MSFAVRDGVYIYISFFSFLFLISICNTRGGKIFQGNLCH